MAATKDLDVTCDGFLDNSFAALQPRKGAHRAGLDAVLLAACLPGDVRSTVADFGAGTGVAGMAVAQRCPQAQAVLIENDPETVRLLRETVRLSRNEHLSNRLSVEEADVTGFSTPPRFDHIIANPPFNAAGRQASPAPRRAVAHMADDGLLTEWVQAAARALKPGGRLTIIVRPDNWPEIEAAASAFGNIVRLPVRAKADREPIRLLLTMRLGASGSGQDLLPLTLHEADGNFTPHVEEVLRGRAGLHVAPATS